MIFGPELIGKRVTITFKVEVGKGEPDIWENFLVTEYNHDPDDDDPDETLTLVKGSEPGYFGVSRHEIESLEVLD